MAGNFERDFGYLMPFLDRMVDSARSADPKVRPELLSLVEGEKARWQRIQALLSGAAASDRPAPTQGPRHRAGSAPVEDVAQAPVRGFTVGSLRRS